MASINGAFKPVTEGPKHHWFGYYDKLQFDPTQRYLLGMEVDFEHRSPRPEDVIRVGMVDLEDGHRWIELGESRAWCWQQGCMLQWRPGSDSEVLWNDREDDRFVCHVLDVNTGALRTLPHPIYTVSPDGTSALAPDFRRINDTRPGYGYAGLPDPYFEEKVPDQSGVCRVDLETGESEFVLSIADIVEIPNPKVATNGAKHYFNHLLYNTDGSRFIFLHRCISEKNKRFMTRALTASPDGEDVHVVNDSGTWSHFIWRDPDHILSWSHQDANGSAMHVNRDRTDHVEVLGKGVITKDAHISYLPGNEWAIVDAYPDKERNQTLHLYHIPTNRMEFLGAFHTPEPYTGEWRCDLHPRFSPDGKYLCIDSPHTGCGRQMHVMDISEVTG